MIHNNILFALSDGWLLPPSDIFTLSLTGVNVLALGLSTNSLALGLRLDFLASGVEAGVEPVVLGGGALDG